jgi:hypothetical protein
MNRRRGVRARQVLPPGASCTTATTATTANASAAAPWRPPGWAAQQRSLIGAIDAAAPQMVRKYAERGGALLLGDDLDDLYEVFFNWGLAYSLGCADPLLDLSLQSWNAASRTTAAGIQHRAKFSGGDGNNWKQQSIQEYYSVALNPGDAEWYHKGEGSMCFYGFGLADPTISENIRRARLFAELYTDPAHGD